MFHGFETSSVKEQRVDTLRGKFRHKEVDQEEEEEEEEESGWCAFRRRCFLNSDVRVERSCSLFYWGCFGSLPPATACYDLIQPPFPGSEKASNSHNPTFHRPVSRSPGNWTPHCETHWVHEIRVCGGWNRDDKLSLNMNYIDVMELNWLLISPNNLEYNFFCQETGSQFSYKSFLLWHRDEASRALASDTDKSFIYLLESFF